MPVTDIVNAWFRDTCAGGPLARDTEAYNQVITALPDLIARLSPPTTEPAPLADPAPGGKSKT